MDVSQEQINELYSAEVVTQDGENLGSVGHVYLDDHTGDPSWITVKTGWFGTRQSLVPLDGAELTQDGRVRVVPSKDTIQDAPNIEAEAHLSSEDQDELFRYYGEAGVDVSRYGDRTSPPGAGHDLESGAVPQASTEREAAVQDVLSHPGVYDEGYPADTPTGEAASEQAAPEDRARQGLRTARGHMTYRYGRDWHVTMQQTISEIDESAARQRFVDGPQLAVSRVAEGQSVPDYTLVLGAGGNYVRVRHYDANGSVVEVFDYAFVEGDDRLFMDNYKVYVYPDEATTPLSFMESVGHKAWVFRQDGTATCREVVKPMPDARISRYRDLDVSGHWRARPAFGDWDRYGEHPEPGGFTVMEA